MQKESEGVPERAKEQVQVVLSRDPNKLLNFSFSSLLNPSIVEFSSVLGCSGVIDLDDSGSSSPWVDT